MYIEKKMEKVMQVKYFPFITLFCLIGLDRKLAESNRLSLVDFRFQLDIEEELNWAK